MGATLGVGFEDSPHDDRLLRVDLDLLALALGGRDRAVAVRQLAGCEAGTGASFETATRLIREIDQIGVCEHGTHASQHSRALLAGVDAVGHAEQVDAGKGEIVEEAVGVRLPPRNPGQVLGDDDVYPLRFDGLQKRLDAGPLEGRAGHRTVHEDQPIRNRSAALGHEPAAARDLILDSSFCSAAPTSSARKWPSARVRGSPSPGPPPPQGRLGEPPTEAPLRRAERPPQPVLPHSLCGRRARESPGPLGDTLPNDAERVSADSLCLGGDALQVSVEDLPLGLPRFAERSPCLTGHCGSPVCVGLALPNRTRP